ncbi:MAG: DUF4093 domain-containing protein [Eubacterium sp.]|nr:DUF4093 domain-containing protein [Eubacterium sp.]
MLKIKEAVIVEGKYDKIKLSNLIDALIIETNGFSIYKDKEKLDFIKKLADERGVIILTDSDHSGTQIRNYLADVLKESTYKHIYIPDIYGKERRKAQPSKEGKLGVEGMSDALLAELFEKSKVNFSLTENNNPVTSYDLYELGISGRADAKEKKRALLKALSLPEVLSTSSLLSYVNSSMTREEFITLCRTL